MKNDINNILHNWFIVNGYCKKLPLNYNAKVLLSAFELVRNSNRLSVEGFRYIIENLPDVDIDADKMLEKTNTLYKKFCGVIDGEVILVEDFVKELLK
jgi:hypothetical protein